MRTNTTKEIAVHLKGVSNHAGEALKWFEGKDRARTLLPGDLRLLTAMLDQAQQHIEQAKGKMLAA